MSKTQKQQQQSQEQSQNNALQKVRIDKWLWSARFFRTRSLAKKAIEGGKVHWSSEEGGQGQRIKTSKEVCVGDFLTIKQGSATTMSEKTIVVNALAETRGNATIANTLYEETDESQSRRALHQEQRKLANLARPDNKPNKKQRRDLSRFKSEY